MVGTVSNFLTNTYHDEWSMLIVLVAHCWVSKDLLPISQNESWRNNTINTYHEYMPWIHTMNTCHEYIPWTHTMNTYHEHIPWVHSMNTYHEYIPWTHTMNTYHEYIPWIHTMNTYHEYIPWIHTMNTYHEYIPWIHTMSTYHEYITYHECIPWIHTFRLDRATKPAGPCPQAIPALGGPIWSSPGTASHCVGDRACFIFGRCEVAGTVLYRQKPISRLVSFARSGPEKQRSKRGEILVLLSTYGKRVFTENGM